jgi:hypothetical protein
MPDEVWQDIGRGQNHSGFRGMPPDWKQWCANCARFRNMVRDATWILKQVQDDEAGCGKP